MVAYYSLSACVYVSYLQEQNIVKFKFLQKKWQRKLKSNKPSHGHIKSLFMLCLKVGNISLFFFR